MAAIVRSEHDLPSVRITLGRGERAAVSFAVRRGRAEVTAEARCTTSNLGLVDLRREEWIPDHVFSVPDHVLDVLGTQLDAIGPSRYQPENAVWLELPAPRGHLYLLPWERMLAPLGRPVLRLPNQTVRPQSPSTSLEVALCASSPMAKSAFDTAHELSRIARVWLDRAGHDVRLHLFTDVNSHARLRDLTADIAAVATVHDPHAADSYGRPERTGRVGTSTNVINPWLLWIADALAGRALDVAHFVTHGYLSGERGAIALASTPLLNTDRMWSRFVGGAEMSGFLARVGAWSLLLTGPPDNFSGLGLRELADAIAMSSPGISATHELTVDHDGAQLAELLDLVYAGGGGSLPPMPGVTCWVHPKFVEFPPDEQESKLVTADGRSSLVKAATQLVLASEHTPSWVASGTHYLENLQSRWLPESADEPIDDDAVAALESVSRLLEKHSQRHLDERGRS